MDETIAPRLPARMTLSDDEATARAYQAVDAIDFEGKQVRRDIGRKASN